MVVNGIRRGTAVFSPCERYRYKLTRTILQDPRRWEQPEDRPVLDRCATVAFLMLNPSTATAEVDDATIRRCIGYVDTWGGVHLTVINLFAYRATDPRELRKVDDPIGPENDAAICEVVGSHSITVCAWGVHGSLAERSRRVVESLRRAGLEQRLRLLTKTSSGEPGHPLRLRADLEPIPFVTP